MYPQMLPVLVFHGRRLIQAQPLLCAAVGLSFILGVTAVSFYASLLGSISRAETLQRTLSKADRPVTPAGKPVVLPFQSLLPFNGAQVLDTLNQVADETTLPLVEVSFVLDDSVNQPYLRYRASLTATASYATIRRFVDQVHANLMDVSLDAISCTRKDIRDVVLACDLRFSAFYRRQPGG